MNEDPAQLPAGREVVTVKLMNPVDFGPAMLDRFMAPPVPGLGNFKTSPSHSFLRERPSGRKLVSDLGIRKDFQNYSRNIAAYIPTTNYDIQKAMLETARSKSPSNSADAVIANAGISRSSGDNLWNLDDPDGEPTKPSLNIVEADLEGSMYAWKLAVRDFGKQPDVPERDRCFIIAGTLVAWIDSPYTSTRYGLRGFMRTARRSSREQAIRINYVAPCWIKSATCTAKYETWLLD
ncbi:putative 5'-hydroxyaverantin dehydrogenase [Seiridium unicorne]|uniref:5'-hydroxyaverantin dehydrogenase n=1 Tax=Seiridium unicorne TaxID=138068 RepID=A0ABR2UR49_9PEZI